MKKRGNRVLAGLLAVLVVLGAVPVQTMGAQYGIQKNKYLDVKKTPTGKTGQNMTISMIFDNSKGSEDLQGVSVRFDDSAVDSEYDAAENPDEETRYNGSIFPFEITSSIFDAKVIGKSGSDQDRFLICESQKRYSRGLLFRTDYRESKRQRCHDGPYQCLDHQVQRNHGIGRR